MMMDYITIAGYTLAVFGAGVAVGKLVEKIERLDRKTEDKDKHIRKNNRRQILQDQAIVFHLKHCKGLAVYRQHLLCNYNSISDMVIQVEF